MKIIRWNIVFAIFVIFCNFSTNASRLTDILLGDIPATILQSFDFVCSRVSGTIANFLQENLFSSISLELITPCGSTKVSLTDVKNLTASNLYDPSKKLVVFAKGFFEQQSVDEFAKAFRCSGEANFVNIDVSLLDYNVFNTEIIGKMVGEALASLSVPVQNFHIMGFSLGAQIAGAVARNYFQNSTNRLPRLTLFDPVKTCFDSDSGLTPAGQDNADYVEVIHTNPNGIGVGNAIGVADFYATRSDRTLPPGCGDILCAHFRSWQYYVETVYPGNENLMATRCLSEDDISEEDCTGEVAEMGFRAGNKVEGVFLLKVNDNSPYRNGNVAGGRADCVNCNM